MGRPENPIAPCDKALDALVRWMRGHRTKAGLSYAQLAERTRHLTLPTGARARCSADTLARAASGLTVPKHRVVLAYAGACGADMAEAERLWKRARYRESRNRCHEEPAPHISYVRDFAELRAALVDLYRKDGSRPYQELEEISGGALTHATVSRVISAVTGRPTRQFVIAFAKACGVRGVALNEWAQAWDRAEERRLGGHRVIRRRQAAIQAKRGPDGAVEVFFDRDRLPDGTEVWRWNRTTNDIARTVAAALNESSRALSPREIEAAHNIRRLRPPAKDRSRHRPPAPVLLVAEPWG